MESQLKNFWSLIAKRHFLNNLGRLGLFKKMLISNEKKPRETQRCQIDSYFSRKIFTVAAQLKVLVRSPSEVDA